MEKVELTVDPAELAQLKPYLEKNDFNGAYKLISKFRSETGKFTDLFLNCGIDPLDYMDEVPDNYATYIHDYQFSLPKHIKKVGEFAFAYTRVYTANLENVNKLSEESFSGCKYLNTITIGDHLKTIPSGCFYNCVSLKKVELPVNVKLVDDLAFADCYNLSHVIIHNPDCSIDYSPSYESFNNCSRTMLVEVRSEKLADEFKECGFTNVNIF